MDHLQPEEMYFEICFCNNYSVVNQQEKDNDLADNALVVKKTRTYSTKDLNSDCSNACINNERYYI